jgi:hypothetical protein
MSIWKALFGGSEEDSEQEKKTKEDGQFDLFSMMVSRLCAWASSTMP